MGRSACAVSHAVIILNDLNEFITFDAVHENPKLKVLRGITLPWCHLFVMLYTRENTRCDICVNEFLMGGHSDVSSVSITYRWCPRFILIVTMWMCYH